MAVKMQATKNPAEGGETAPVAAAPTAAPVAAGPETAGSMETKSMEAKRAEPPVLAPSTLPIPTLSVPTLAIPAAAEGTPQPPAPFSWRRTALILGASFALGIAIAWGAIAIGAHVVGLWPHGFAFYAMLVGGGVTMLLTAALMTAVFYSDSSGHDERVQQFRPNGRIRSDGEKPDG